MAVFAFYKIRVRSLSDSTKLQFPDYEDEGERDVAIDNIFEQEFKEGASFEYAASRNKKTSDKAPYYAEVCANRDGIIVLTIEDNKEKTTIVGKEKYSHEHHPFGNIIIDYKHNFLAIEKTSAFDHKPEKIQNIIAPEFNSLFNDYGYTFGIKMLQHHTDDFWEAVNEIRVNQGDRVKKISLDFSSIGKRTDLGSSDLVDILTEISMRANAKGMFALEAEDNKELDIQSIHEDLVNIADICFENQRYDLVVNFYSYGIYRYGADISAHYGISDLVIENFIDGVDDCDLFGEMDTLEHWLNKMRVLFGNYETETSTTAPTKQSNRR